MVRNLHQLISDITTIPVKTVAQVANLLDDGCTIPFIARYRKEATNGLDEVGIDRISVEIKRLLDLQKRKDTIIATIEEQGKLSLELKRVIDDCWNSVELEDIYLPYKPKRKTRATAARELGLEGLAKAILEQSNRALAVLCSPYINDMVQDSEKALQGARDIIAEMISEDKDVRYAMRRLFEKEAFISSKLIKGKEQEGAKYRDYFEYSEQLRKCPSHRLLAVSRAENEGILRVHALPEEERAVQLVERQWVRGSGPSAEQVRLSVQDAYKRLIQPSMENEVMKTFREKAETEAIKVFAENLKQLLMAAPLGQKRVMGIDPGYRTGCKVVCLSEQGDLLHHTAIFPHPPQSELKQASETLKRLVFEYEVEAIAIGNGTAGRETEAFCRAIDYTDPVDIYMVNEAGASIYSASVTARAEFPDHDITVRGAVSIARRLMDPLAELVKIDPQSIGVGQYQHDVNQAFLKDSLDKVVARCVNSVGVNLNTASKELLSYVSGLGPQLAANIIKYRTEQGAFESRKELLKVPRMGARSFEQAAGFLRIKQGKNPLDDTAVHPERYELVGQIASDLKVDLNTLIKDKTVQKQIDIRSYIRMDVGLPTLTDIVHELAMPGLDPRGETKVFQFAPGVNAPEDLREGMVLSGIVTNITNFGAFVDIGVKQDGLVHVSQLSNKFVKDPNEVVKLGQIVEVRVSGLDLPRKRIELSMKAV
jgi:protein Tex